MTNLLLAADRLLGCRHAGCWSQSARQEAAAARRFAGLWQRVAPCGGLWQPVATDWVALRNLCRLGGPRIIRSSDAGIIGWSDLADHLRSDLRSSAVWVCSKGLTGQMVDDARNDDEKNDWKKFSHARAWGARRIILKGCGGGGVRSYYVASHQKKSYAHLAKTP